MQTSAANGTAPVPGHERELEDARRELASLRQQLADQHAELERAMHALEIAKNTRDGFLSSVSHELRTPLSAILLWTSLIDEKKVNDPQLAEALAAIKQSAEEQHALIEDLVTTARLLAGTLRTDRVETDLAVVAREALADVAAAAREKQVSLVEKFAATAPRLTGDSLRLRQMLRHLLLNAIRASSPGGEVVVALKREGGNLVLSVTDRGSGMEPEFLRQVLARSAADAKTPRTESGLGLGIPLAQRIAALHGGTLSGESAGRGQGAAFTVRFPGAARKSPDAATETRPLSQRSVLAVLGDATNDAPLTAQLAGAGAEVRVVRSEADAWRAFSQKTPEVILAEVGASAKDGSAFVRRVRAHEEAHGARTTPAIALAGDAANTIVEGALETGFQTCLTGNAERADVVVTIALLLEEHS